MKINYLPLQYKYNLNKKILPQLKKLPYPLALVYSIQYKDLAEEIQKKLEPNFISQVLGCSNPKFPDNTKAILLIGQSRFHAIGLAIEKNLPVFVFDNNSLVEISKKEISSLQNKKQGALSKFLMSKKVGVLISTKLGQKRLKRALDLSKIYPDKNFYFFISDDLKLSERENYFVDSWINTACPRMDLDIHVLNLADIPKL